MPIYGYVCTNCGHELDALQKISEAPLTDCPSCGAAALKRQLSAPRFRLKGSGWYETDFKKDNQRNLAASDSEKPQADKPKSDKSDKSDKADSKPKADKSASGDSKAS